MKFLLVFCTFLASFNSFAFKIGMTKEVDKLIPMYKADLKRLYKNIGVDAEVVMFDQGHLGKALAENRIDSVALISDLRSKSWSNVLKVNPPIFSNIYIIKYSGAQKNRAKVSCLKGAIYCDLIAKKNLVTAESYEAAIELFNSRKVDHFIMPNGVFQFYRKKVTRISTQEIVQKNFYFHVVKKKHKKIKDKIEEEFYKFESTGGFDYKKIIEKKRLNNAKPYKWKPQGQ